MTKTILLATALIAAPMFASAMPAIGDHVGNTPETATAALGDAGCTVTKFGAEDGMIEAKCDDANKAHWEVYIDPTSGDVVKIKEND
ncbi:PepSY domain-containing protein (plasmid) [Thioclava litoralis]|uniref:PepSY domain-containing protein n=1 Tax=Thioclava litoralis TaxID=3076557 RepID=A0ABZ1E542_9RHOB|nr:PepSY domain-containing protein [Thioclava sp. FTW29]